MKKFLFLLALLGLFAIWFIFFSDYHSGDHPVVEKNVVYEEINKDGIGCKIEMSGKLDPYVTVYESGKEVNVVNIIAGADVIIKDVKYLNFMGSDQKDIFIEYSERLIGMTNPVYSTLAIISKVDGLYKVISDMSYFVREEINENNKTGASGCADEYEIIDSAEGRLIRFTCDEGPMEYIWKRNKMMRFFPKKK